MALALIFFGMMTGALAAVFVWVLGLGFLLAFGAYLGFGVLGTGLCALALAFRGPSHPAGRAPPADLGLPAG